jgi:hypothetical protein
VPDDPLDHYSDSELRRRLEQRGVAEMTAGRLVDQREDPDVRATIRNYLGL